MGDLLCPVWNSVLWAGASNPSSIFCVGTPVGVNVSVFLSDPLLGVALAPLLVVSPLEVAPPLEVVPLMRSRGLSVVQAWVRLGLGCKQGGSGGEVEADWGVSWAGWDEPSVSAYALGWS